ncbi:hypothetical protein [Corynebacterium liangguodongii]|uniref:Uncharacterized protein n=1 Tax=Corynebacterium liangguodongii TaxID=2079535 RepID=A0A2S0WEX6_9CORY|nr:hypothetical protein [Corynebacterium liangguodongii]AWB84333.1 hypothetical protein C3E79_07435 [Corynebacterium liangguodongii]PWB99823.1 hypothetical protein DF219_04030 [Corynebacterium liangguodongii]
MTRRTTTALLSAATAAALALGGVNAPADAAETTAVSVDQEATPPAETSADTAGTDAEDPKEDGAKDQTSSEKLVESSSLSEKGQEAFQWMGVAVAILSGLVQVATIIISISPSAQNWLRTVVGKPAA